MPMSGAATEEEPFSPTIRGNVDAERTTLDTKEHTPPLQRFDSTCHPIDGAHPPQEAKCVEDPEHTPGTSSAFYSMTPAKGKYVALIEQLLLMDPKDKSYLNAEIAQDLCSDAAALLREEPSLLELQVEQGETLVVVGDVHGQFADLVKHILSQQYDRPKGAKDRRFLFLGDFVDRGPNGVEVVMLLMALKLEYPKMIYMLRGNHEESQTSRIYGFMMECRQKFGDVSLFGAFNITFSMLPLAAKVSAPGRQFMCAHGGLSPQLTHLETINDIPRSEYGGCMDPHSEGIVDGLLWSDPTDEVDDYENNERGCGYIFGPRATAEFCAANELNFIVRAHQLTAEGYCYTHDGHCITVFSAPNYCGCNNNKGAIMLVSEDLEFVQYTTAAAAGTAPLPMTMPWSMLFM